MSKLQHSGKIKYRAANMAVIIGILLCTGVVIFAIIRVSGGFLPTPNNSKTEAKIVTQSGTDPECSDHKYKIPTNSERIIPFMTYTEYYGVGKFPEPNAEICNSNIGKIFEVFPDENFATCVSELLGVDTSAQISQHFLDNVATLSFLDFAVAKFPETRCSQVFSKITDFTGLEKFRNLRDINVSAPNMVDITFFENMPFMMHVNLYNTSIIDTAPLAKLKKLQDITLPQNKSKINTQPLTDAGYSFR